MRLTKQLILKSPYFNLILPPSHQILSPTKTFSPTAIFITEFQFYHLYHQTIPIIVQPFPKVQYKLLLHHELMLPLARLLLTSRIFFLVPHMTM